MKNLARGAWLAACLAVLVWFFASPATDVDVAVGWFLLLLTFPVGLLVMWAWGGAFWALHSWAGVDPGREWTVLLWLIAVVAGYWQWFHLVPRLVRRLRRDRVEPC